MHRRHLRLLSVIAVAAVLFSAWPAAASPSRGKLARHAAAYVKRSQQDNGSVPGFSPIGSTADYVVALVSVHRGPRTLRHALGFLRRQVRKDNVTSAGLLGKVAMAVVAAGQNPRLFGHRNLVRKLKGQEQTSGEYGDGSDGLKMSDHVLAMLGLEAARVRPDERAVRWLAKGQCPDGGWQYDKPYKASRDDRHCRAGAGDFSASDTNTTSYAVQALRASSGTYDLKARPFRYLDSARDRHKHGWVYDATHRCSKGVATRCELTDTNSSALVIQAYLAAGKRIPARGMKALEALQYRKLCGKPDGAFAYTWEKRSGKLHRSPTRTEAATYGASNVGATIGAVAALAHEKLPPAPGGVSGPLPAFDHC